MSDTQSGTKPFRRLLSRGRRSHEPRSTKRLIITAVLGVGGVIVLLGVAWVVVTGVLARGQLNHLKKELPRLRHALSDGRLDDARSISADISKSAQRAHQLTTGPAWWMGAETPIVGTPLRTSRIIAGASDDIGRHVLPDLLNLADTLTSSSLRHGPAINLQPIAKADRDLTATRSAVVEAADNVRSAPASWLPSIGSARESAVTNLDTLRDQVTAASRAVHTLLPMLGQSKPQRYFVGFLNEAQARGLGGLPGAFAIVTADHGTVKFTHFENDNTLAKVSVNLDLGRDFAERYRDAEPTKNYGDSTFSPHFPYAARIWAAMWEKESGEHIDGALALDPTALSYLLAVTGPASLPNGQRVSSADIVALTQQKQYSLFPDGVERKKYLIDIADAVSRRLLSGHGKTKNLVQAAARAAGQRRLLLWSADPAVEANLVRAGFAGVVEADGAPVAGFVVNNNSGSKLDYYLRRSMTYERTGCLSTSTALATFTMINGAPASGLPTYVTLRRHDRPPGFKPGDNRLLVTYYGSAGATVRSVTVDGKQVRATIERENRLMTATVAVEIRAGATVKVTVALREPPTSRSVQVLKQPLVHPLRVKINDAKCG